MVRGLVVVGMVVLLGLLVGVQFMPAEAQAEPKASAAPAAGAAANGALQRTPEAWLEQIRRLKREGREQEAQAQLALFRRAYPDYAIPENLRGLR